MELTGFRKLLSMLMLTRVSNTVYCGQFLKYKFDVQMNAKTSRKRKK